MKSSGYHRIVLIGYRGAGKSTLADHLSQALGWKVFSTDQWIEQYTQQPISQLVNKEGWDYFRRIEALAIREAIQQKEVIIDCGGGVVENPENMRLLSRHSLVVWVDADISDFYQRLKNSTERPLLNQPDWKRDIDVNYRRREKLYRQYSDLYLNTSAESPETLCRKVLDRIFPK